MKYPDPYEGMSDAEVDEELDRLFAKPHAKTVVVSIRMPEELLVRVKRLADALVPLPGSAGYSPDFARGRL